MGQKVGQSPRASRGRHQKKAGIPAGSQKTKQVGDLLVEDHKIRT